MVQRTESHKRYRGYCCRLAAFVTLVFVCFVRSHRVTTKAGITVDQIQEPSQRLGVTPVSRFYFNRYRIADIVKGVPRASDNICLRFPQTLGCLYTELSNGTSSNITLLLHILQQRRLTAVPQDNDIVVHLRLGDGLCAYVDNPPCPQMRTRTPDCWNDSADCWRGGELGQHHFAYSKDAYFPVLRELLRAHLGKRIIVISEKRHWTRSSDPRTGDFTVDDTYVQNFVSFFESQGFAVIVFQPRTPDDDFQFACAAQTFIPGGGGYSDLIGTVVAANGGVVIRPQWEERAMFLSPNT